MQPDFVYTLTTPPGVQQRIPITLVEEHGSIAVPDTFTPPDWAALRTGDKMAEKKELLVLHRSLSRPRPDHERKLEASTYLT